MSENHVTEEFVSPTDVIMGSIASVIKILKKDTTTT